MPTITGSETFKLQDSDIALRSIAASVGVIATTIHAQDFRDVEGDQAIGRRTVPIVYGSWAKYMVLFPVPVWSAGLSALWELDMTASALFILLGFSVGARYVTAQTVRDYKTAFSWYNVRRSASRVYRLC